MPICGNLKVLELGAWCHISELFLYLSGVIHLIGQYLIGEVLRYNRVLIHWYGRLKYNNVKISGYCLTNRKTYTTERSCKSIDRSTSLEVVLSNIYDKNQSPC